jgi:two-component system sensor histidine kinase KdpD
LGVTLERRCPATVPIRTDPVRLEQILVNLVTNAIRHAPRDSAVSVVVDRDHDATIRVSDRGPGIPVELRERVFQPFERFDPDSGGGTGLGLAVAYRMAELLGGQLRVGDNPGGGAAFILTLPRETVAASS